jgi:hypothetical protein
MGFFLNPFVSVDTLEYGLLLKHVGKTLDCIRVLDHLFATNGSDEPLR